MGTQTKKGDGQQHLAGLHYLRIMHRSPPYELCIDRHHTNYAAAALLTPFSVLVICDIATIRIMQQLHYLLRFPFW
jgi:hypothetical protein